MVRQSKFRTRVPPERLLIETDQKYNDPPNAIPYRIEWVEHLLAQQLKCSIQDIRRLVWQNFTDIVNNTQTNFMFPKILIA